MRSGLLILIAVVALASAVPVKRESKSELAENKCATQCSGTHNKYRYTTGKSYEYALSSSTDVEIPTHRQHNTNITQEGKLWITVHSPCEFEMNIESLTASGNVPKHFTREMTARPVRFAFDDGKIDRICADDDEPTWVLNVKRGILAALQNAWEADELTVHEEDISGRCQSTYNSEVQGEETHYKRRKHSHSCRGHHNMHGAMRSTQYESEADLSSDMSRATHECTHKVSKAGLLKEASCVERQSFEPFEKSGEQGGSIRSTTRVTIKLLNNIKNAGQRMSIKTRKSMHFDASEMDYELADGSKTEAVNALKRLCDTSDLYIVKETPALFVKLVKSLRGMPEEELVSLVKSSQNGDCDKQSKFLLDALPMCGSEPCVATMVYVLKSKTLSTADKQAYFTSLAFVPKASLKMVESLVSIVDKEAGHVRGLLGVSSLVHTYCLQHSDCENDAPVKSLVSKLTAKLGDKCRTDGSGKQVEQMVIVLKALGNIGHVHKAVNKVIACAQQRHNPVEVRVAAVQSMRRLPCQHEERKHLMPLFQNMNEDVELRIFTFLTLVKCPSTELVAQINTQLENERVNQVGSFVWSYLKSRRASTDPTQRVMKAIVRQQGISRRFERDPRQYSRFYETGSFSTAANSGAHMEQGVIFVPGSFTPRHVYANMSMHLFGHSINFFEFGARAEGLDHLYNNMMGPEGLIERPNAAVFGDKTEQSGDYDQLEEAFEQRPHYESRDRLAISAYVRIFGDELAYHGLDDPRVMDTIKSKTDFKVISDFLAKQQQMRMAKNVMFVDLVKTLPTSGLPLRLTVTGVAALNVEAEGKMDATNMFKKPHDLEVRTSLKPSAAVEIATTLSINVAGMQSGFRVVSRMHTTTAIEHELSIKDGKVITFKVGVPQKQMKLIDFEIDAVGLVENEQVVIVAATDYKESRYCSPEKWNTLVGMETCYGYRQPADKTHKFPRRFWIELEKTDDTLQTYEMKLELARTPMPYPKLISFDTPGSAVDRRVMLEVIPGDDVLVVDVNVPEHTVRLELPKSVEGGKDTYAQKLILTIDEEDTYEFDGKLRRTMTQGMSRTELTAVAKRPSGEDVTLNTHIAYHGFTKMDAKFEVKGINEIPFMAKAVLQLPSEKDSNAIIKLNHECPSYKTIFEMEGKSHGKDNYKLKFVTELASQIDEFETMSARLNVEKKVQQGRQHMKFDLVKSVHPQSNFELDIKADKEKIDATLKYGNQLTSQATFDIERKTAAKKHTITANVAVPDVHIDHRVEAVYENDFPHKLHARATITSKGSDKIEVEAIFKRKMEPKYELIAELSAKRTGGMDYLLKKTLHQTSEGKYTSKTLIQWAAGRQIEVDAKLIMEHPGRYEFNYVVAADAKMSGMADPIKLHKTIKVTEKEYKWAALLKRGSHAVYDVNVEVLKVSKTKNTFKSHVKSHYMATGEFDLAGTWETKEATRELNMNVKKNGKQFAKLSTRTPKSMMSGWATEAKDLKVHTEWKMDKPSSKSEIMLEYKLNHVDENTRGHTLVALSKIGGGKVYKLTSIVSKNGQYTMNNTLEIDTKRAVALSWGVSSGSAGQYHKQIDFSFKTSAPYTVQHLTGLAVVSGGKGKYHAHVDVTCHVTKNKALVDVTGMYKGDLKDVVIKIEAGKHVRLYLEEKRNEKTVVTETNMSLQWAEDKKIVMSRKLNLKGMMNGGNTLSEMTLTTPFEALPSVNAKIQRSVHANKVDYIAYVKGSNVNEFDLFVERLGGKDEEATGYTLKLKTNNEEIGTIVGKIDMKSTMEKHMEMDNLMVELKWGKDKKIHLHRSFGCDLDESKCSYNGLWEAKLGGSKHIKTRALYTQNGKAHVVEVELKKNQDTYMINSEFNSESLDGKVKISTPHSQMKTASIKLSKAGEHEYRITTERNGAESVQVEGTLKKTSKGRKLRLNINNIETPVKIEAEFDRHTSNRHMKLIVTPNYEGDDATPYGIEMLKQPTKLALTLVTPLRRPHFEIRRPSAHIVEIGAQIDRDGREMTKIQFVKASSGSPNQIVFMDPALTHPVKVQVEYKPSTRCPTGGEDAECRTEEVHFAIVYSDKDSAKFETILGSSWKTESDMHHIVFVVVKHPISHYHQKYYVDVENNAALKRVEVGVEILRQPKTHKYALESKMAQGEQPEFKITSPSGVQSLKYEKVGHEHRMLLLSEDDQQPSFVFAAQMKNGKYQLELRKGASSQVLLHVSDKLVDKNTIVSKMYHINGDRKHEDVYVKLWLENHSLLKLRLHVSPSSWANLLDTIVNHPIDFESSDNSLVRDILESHVEGLGKYNKAIVKYTKPVVDAWKVERDSLTDDMGLTFRDMYDMGIDYYEMAHELLMAKIDMMEMSLERYTKEMQYPSAHQMYRDSARTSRAILAAIVEPIRDSYTAVIEALYRVSEQIQETNESVREYFEDNEMLEELSTAVKKLIKTLKSITSYDEVKRSATQWMDSVQENTASYSSVYDTLMDYSILRGIHMAVQPAIDELVTYDVREMIDAVLEYVQTTVENQKLANYLPKVNLFNMKKGQVEIQFPLPIRADSLADLANKIEPAALRQYLNKVQTRLTKIVSQNGEISEELWKREGARKPINLLETEIDSAHYSIGYVMGDRHIITFDGKLISLTSDCEYLLAQDFLSNKFTLSAKFAKIGGKTEVTEVKAKLRGEKIVISRDGLVTINGKKVELPYQKVDDFEGEAIVQLVRLDHGVRLTTFDGVEIEFEFYHRQCMVRLPGRYHGHSNGLMGSNDNEASNDLHMADGKTNEDAAKFADQWVIGKACKATVAKPNATPSVTEKCDALFKSRSSELSTCFRRVAPRAFHTMCQYDKCNATAAYVRACHQAGLESSISLPVDCVRCESVGMSMREQEIKTVQTNGGSKTVDIVFVVEERPCMEFVKEQLVDNVASKIVAKLGGLSSSVRFGVIGFGGEEVHNAPHFHTGGYALNFDKNGLRSAVESLDFKADYATSQWQDPLAAVDFTTIEYPFRPTAAKAIVLLTCGECGEQVDYYEVQQRLLEENIQMHVYTTKDIIVDSQDVETIGPLNYRFSATHLFTTNQGSSESLREGLTSPHDSCTILAQEMNGTVWTLANEDSSEFTIPAKHIGKAIQEQAKLNECMVCQCEAFELAPRTKCQPCDILTPASMTSNSFFNNPLIALRKLGKKVQASVNADEPAFMI